ncbi:response regulator transcription factor [Thermovirga sp.]|uniref:response regulator transcription factor n=1 Tax=Thermovirga sp. TaxID=2699834 RepID=UPI0025F650AF|nr:response regulator transcription factor [Thermovirga sp.]MBO8154318.1 response regulator transcription factor [Thermovirga sp.]
MHSERILVVEDEEALSDILRDALKRHGYKIERAFDGDTGLEMAEKLLPDLIILDIMLPRMDGWEVCRRLKENKKTSAIPIILLTARRDEQDVVAGLDLGADDYIRKPFSLIELAARVRSVLRRSKANNNKENSIKIGPLEMDFERQIVSLWGENLDLSPTEYHLLEILARNKERVLSREELLAKGWGYYLGDSRTVDVHISRLRRKIEEDPENPKLLHTVRGRGYMIKWKEKSA